MVSPPPRFMINVELAPTASTKFPRSQHACWLSIVACIFGAAVALGAAQLLDVACFSAQPAAARRVTPRKALVQWRWREPSFRRGSCRATLASPGRCVRRSRALQSAESNVLPGEDYDEYVVRYAIGGSTGVGNATAAGMLLNWMLDNGMLPRRSSFVEVVKAHTRKRTLPGCWAALRYLKAMVQADHDVDPDSMRDLFREFAALEDFAAAFEVFEAMRALQVSGDAAAYTTLIAGCAKRGHWRDARRWLDRALTDEHVPPTVVWYNAAMAAHARKRDPAAAATLFNQLCSQQLQPDVLSYNALISACARQDDPVRAERWFTDMLDARIEPNRESFRDVMLAHMRAGRRSEAKQWFDELEHQGFDVGLEIFTAMVRASAVAGDADQVTQWLEVIQKRRISADRKLYGAVVSGFAARKDVDVCSEWMRRMKATRLSPGLEEYTQALNACVGLSPRPPVAEEWLQELRQARIRPDQQLIGVLERLRFPRPPPPQRRQ